MQLYTKSTQHTPSHAQQHKHNTAVSAGQVFPKEQAIGMPGKKTDQRPQRHPPLVLRDTVRKVRLRDELAEGNGVVPHPPQPHHAHRLMRGRSDLSFGSGGLGHRLEQERSGVRRKLDPQDPVKRARPVPLLEVAEDVVSDDEYSLPLLAQHATHERGREVLAATLVPDNDAPLEPVLELLEKEPHVALEVGDGELLLKHVGGVRTPGQRRHGCQVTAEASHRLHHKDPLAAGVGGELEGVARRYDDVDGRVAPEAVLCAGNVVADGGRDA